MRRLLLASLLVVPSLAAAQRGGGGRSQATTHSSSPDQALPSGPALRTRDIEELNPIKFLIDKRKDLKLTDSQLGNLKAAEPKLKQQNDPLYRAVDSLVHEMRPSLNSSDEERARIRDAANGLRTTLGQINSNFDAANKEALAGLEPEQQSKATEMFTKQREDAQKTVMEKMGGGGRRGGGDRPPPPR